MLNGFGFSDSQDSSDDDEPPGGYSSSDAYVTDITDSVTRLFCLEKDIWFSGYGSELPYRTTYDVLKEHFRDLLNM